LSKHTRKDFQIIITLATAQLSRENQYLFLGTWCWKDT